MTGEEAIQVRLARGYTQAEVANLLVLSEPTVSRRERAKEVPEEYAAALLRLPPAQRAEGSRGANQRKTLAVPRRQSVPRPAAPARPPQEPTAQAARTPEPERIWEAEEIGAVLLEGADLRRRWLLVTAWRQLLLARRRLAGREVTPCL